VDGYFVRSAVCSLLAVLRPFPSRSTRCGHLSGICVVVVLFGVAVVRDVAFGGVWWHHCGVVSRGSRVLTHGVVGVERGGGEKGWWWKGVVMVRGVGVGVIT
jgi:hypothetical protein